MAWIELHQTVWTHRKTLDLAAMLGVQPIIAVAHMAQLWTWALDNARLDFDRKRALLTGIRPGVVALGAQWLGDADTFLAAIIDSGYVDRDGDDLVLAGWWQLAGRHIERNAHNAMRGKARRSFGGAVLDRDGYRCRHCGATQKLSLDHIVPISRGGGNGYDNLQTLCRPCNSRKGAR